MVSLSIPIESTCSVPVKVPDLAMPPATKIPGTLVVDIDEAESLAAPRASVSEKYLATVFAVES